MRQRRPTSIKFAYNGGGSLHRHGLAQASRGCDEQLDNQTTGNGTAVGSLPQQQRRFHRGRRHLGLPQSTIGNAPFAATQTDQANLSSCYNASLNNTNDAAATVTVSGIPYSSYSVYVYFGSGVNGRDGRRGDGWLRLITSQQ